MPSAIRLQANLYFIFTPCMAMKIVTTYPKVVFLLEVPVNQTPMHTMQ